MIKTSKNGSLTFQNRAPILVLPLVFINFVYMWLTDWWRSQFLIETVFFFFFHLQPWYDMAYPFKINPTQKINPTLIEINSILIKPEFKSTLNFFYGIQKMAFWFRDNFAKTNISNYECFSYALRSILSLQRSKSLPCLERKLFGQKGITFLSVPLSLLSFILTLAQVYKDGNGAEWVRFRPAPTRPKKPVYYPTPSASTGTRLTQPDPILSLFFFLGAKSTKGNH